MAKCLSLILLINGKISYRKNPKLNVKYSLKILRATKQVFIESYEKA